MAKKQVRVILPWVSVLASVGISMSLGFAMGSRTIEASADMEPETKVVEKIVTIEKEVPVAVTSEPFKYVGDFKVTAYCSCVKCCGKYAIGRPKVDGKEVVYTANESIATEGITCAVDPNVIPLGSEIYIEGVGVRIAQDTGSAVDGNVIDIYYDSHKEALHSEVNSNSRKVWILNTPEED